MIRHQMTDSIKNNVLTVRVACVVVLHHSLRVEMFWNVQECEVVNRSDETECLDTFQPIREKGQNIQLVMLIK